MNLRPMMCRGSVALMIFAAACGPRSSQDTPPGAVPSAAARDRCLVPVGRSGALDTVTVVLAGTVNPARALDPSSEAERFLFRALYETLIRVDCAGGALPALASAWAPEDDGRRWTFVLRPDARFWDGEPVTAQDVVAGWIARDTLGAYAPWDGPVVQAAQVMSERVVSVQLRRRFTSPPAALAHPALAVVKSAGGVHWPIGTGRYWVSESAPTIAAAAFGDPLPAMRIEPLAGRDARDALDRGADLVVTGDPAVIGYAGSRSDLETVPLPWDRTYVLLTPPAGTGQSGFSVDPAGLSRDAVKAEARAPAAPFWWTSDAACAPPATPPAAPRATSTRNPRRVVYRRGDPIARDLAHRIVALSDQRSAATALTGDALAADLAAGRSAAYVLELPRNVLDPCLETGRLVARAPWLAPRSIVPLLETRERLVLRRSGPPPMTLDWDGTIRLLPR
jgi:hypothetical protein